MFQCVCSWSNKNQWEGRKKERERERTCTGTVALFMCRTSPLLPRKADLDPRQVSTPPYEGGSIRGEEGLPLCSQYVYCTHLAEEESGGCAIPWRPSRMRPRLHWSSVSASWLGKISWMDERPSWRVFGDEGKNPPESKPGLNMAIGTVRCY